MSVASKIKRSISSWKGVLAFKTLPLPKRKIVFYVEDGGYWNYFKDIYTALQTGSEIPRPGDFSFGFHTLDGPTGRQTGGRLSHSNLISLDQAQC